MEATEGHTGGSESQTDKEPTTAGSVLVLKTQTNEITALKTTVEQLQAQVNGKKNPGNGGDNGKWAWKAIAPKSKVVDYIQEGPSWTGLRAKQEYG